MKNHWNFETDSGYTGIVAAIDEQSAAEEAWAFMCHRDPDNYGGGEVEVWKDDQPRFRFKVEVETVPQFHAKLVKPKDAPVASPLPPKPECDHQWEIDGDRDVCKRCGSRTNPVM